MKIYTRTGDEGATGLFGGGRVPKDDPRVEAYGSVDELNSVLGLVGALLDDRAGEWREPLRRIQSDLFTIGALLATPEAGKGKPKVPELDRRRVAEMEEWIDQLDEDLPPLRSFILPGGSPLAAHLHFSRTVCRRAERRAVALSHKVEVEPQILVYLNRLSDLLFVLARSANARAGVPDAEWNPEEG